MPWKDDGKGGLAMDNGAPVWVGEDGAEKRVDYEAMTKRLAEVTKVSIERVPHACGDEPGDHVGSPLRMCSLCRPIWAWSSSGGGLLEMLARNAL